MMRHRSRGNEDRRFPSALKTSSWPLLGSKLPTIRISGSNCPASAGFGEKLKDWTGNASGALTVAALLGCVGILVHSFLDFNLQIPANAALFYVLAAIAASAPLQESQRRRSNRRHRLIVKPQPETATS